MAGHIKAQGGDRGDCFLILERSTLALSCWIEVESVAAEVKVGSALHSEQIHLIESAVKALLAYTAGAGAASHSCRTHRVPLHSSRQVGLRSGGKVGMFLGPLEISFHRIKLAVFIEAAVVFHRHGPIKAPRIPDFLHPLFQEIVHRFL